jgi:hypothetical protein
VTPTQTATLLRLIADVVVAADLDVIQVSTSKDGARLLLRGGAFPLGAIVTKDRLGTLDDTGRIRRTREATYRELLLVIITHEPGDTP